MVVPTMLSLILADLDRRQDAGLPDLRHLSYGGGRMPIDLIEEAMRALPDVNYVNVYGLTETSSTVADKTRGSPTRFRRRRRRGRRPPQLGRSAAARRSSSRSSAPRGMSPARG